MLLSPHPSHPPETAWWEKEAIFGGSHHGLELHSDWAGLDHGTFPYPITVAQECCALIGSGRSHMLQRPPGTVKRERFEVATVGHGRVTPPRAEGPANCAAPQEKEARESVSMHAASAAACAQSLHSSCELAVAVPLSQMRKLRLGEFLGSLGSPGVGSPWCAESSRDGRAEPSLAPQERPAQPVTDL